MTKKIKGQGPQTGEDFIELAKKRGAKVSAAKSGFVNVETPAGKAIIYPTKEKLDKQSIANIKRWFRLLGLMAIGLFLIDFFWGILQLPPIGTF